MKYVALPCVKKWMSTWTFKLLILTELKSGSKWLNKDNGLLWIHNWLLCDDSMCALKFSVQTTFTGLWCLFFLQTTGCAKIKYMWWVLRHKWWGDPFSLIALTVPVIWPKPLVLKLLYRLTLCWRVVVGRLWGDVVGGHTQRDETDSYSWIHKLIASHTKLNQLPN